MDEFDKWNHVKKRLHSDSVYRGFKEREIFYAHIGENIGFEQNGKGEKFMRPVLIIKKFNRFVFSGIPLSTTSKRGKYYFEFQFTEEKTSVAVVSQMKLFDTKRLVNKIGMINKEDFIDLKQRIKEVYTL